VIAACAVTRRLTKKPIGEWRQLASNNSSRSRSAAKSALALAALQYKIPIEVLSDGHADHGADRVVAHAGEIREAIIVHRRFGLDGLAGGIAEQ